MYFIENPHKNILENNADELFIITGYISPSIFDELFSVKRYKKVVVYVGMYGCINKSVKKSLELMQEKYSELEIFYTNKRVHIKTYIFKKNNEITKIVKGRLCEWS